MPFLGKEYEVLLFDTTAFWLNYCQKKFRFGTTKVVILTFSKKNWEAVQHGLNDTARYP